MLTVNTILFAKVTNLLQTKENLPGNCIRVLIPTFSTDFVQKLFSSPFSITRFISCLFVFCHKEREQHGQCEHTEDDSQADGGRHFYMRNVQVQA